ncbi:MAG: hypothetical protein Q8K79_02640 [Solirubrobacteraceae bacterium]|nr:hypothetical protein [Solirubrobacteraceae bacterium]
MNGNEHRAVGDAASGGALVNVGGTTAQAQFWLGFGDVMALSGDYFRPGPSAGRRDDSHADGGEHIATLFSLARVPGERGTKPGTRDEIVCALRVMTVDEACVDARFAPGGEFADFTRGAQRSRRDVERRVRDRHLILAATNDDHFVDPGGTTHPGRAGSAAFGSAPVAYRRLHEVALEQACRLGRVHGDAAQALAREAAAQHFLTDAFTAGHMRTPVAQIRRFWRARYPTFWQDLQGRVAADTAATLRELTRAARLAPERFLHDATLAAVRRRTEPYPQLSVGDFLARLFHDWDNAHGLEIEGGDLVFGDGHVHEGATRGLAVAAARAGIDDVAVAFGLGEAGSRLTGEPLYRAVRAATGACDRLFRPESMIPRTSARNPPQNWRAPDFESLWDGPIVGSCATTVGEALTEMMDPDGLFIRQLDRLGRSLVDARGLLAVPLLGGWLARNGAAAYHRGFVERLAAQPRQAILSVIHADAGGEGVAGDARAAPAPFVIPRTREL